MDKFKKGDIVTMWRFHDDERYRRCAWLLMLEDECDPGMHKKYTSAQILAPGDLADLSVGFILGISRDEDELKVQKRPPGWVWAKIAELALLGETE